MPGPSHRTITSRDWKHELARCSACGAGVRIEKASQQMRVEGSREELVVYQCPRCDATTHFHISDAEVAL